MGKVPLAVFWIYTDYQNLKYMNTFTRMMALLLLVAGCAPKETPSTENVPPTQQEMQETPTADTALEFSEHGLSFTVPETWAKSEFSISLTPRNTTIRVFAI
jgi:hypothetical protein